MAFNAQRNDVAKFTEGTWVTIMGGQFKIARAGNPEYEQALEDSGYRNIEDDPAAKQRALYRAIATGVLKDWADVEDDNEAAIPFSVDNAVTVLLENPDLVGRVLTEANTLSNYRREDAAKQSGKRATGSGSPKSGASKGAA